MKRTFFIVLAVTAIASAASAATLAVAPDKLTYFVGETITLTISGVVPQGASSYGIFGQLKYSGGGSVTPTSQTQKLVGTGWISGKLGNGALYSDAFNQIAFPDASTATNLPGKNPFATITLLATGGPGLVNVNWNTATGSGFELNFFGLTNTPGTSFFVFPCTGEFGACPPVPEPGTGALLGLGLVALGLARGRTLPRDTR